MRKDSILDFIGKKIVIFDGAMGTMLQHKGLKLGECPELWNITKPDYIKEIHRAYIDAGAMVITTNTFGGNVFKLKEYNLQNEIERINAKAVKLATEVATDKALIAGDIGPTGLLLKPLGELSFDEAVATFYTQAKYLKNAGADLIIIETMSDLLELKAAIIGAKETRLPVIATMTFEKGRTLTGTDPTTFAITVENIGLIALGSNCSNGPGEMIEIAEKITDSTNLPVIIQPNAGKPKIDENAKAVYDLSIKEFVNCSLKYIANGVSIVGGCCGTTPLHIKALRDRLHGRSLKRKHIISGLKCSSRTKYVEIGLDRRLCIIGERLNPTGRKDLSIELREGKSGLIRKEAIAQKNAGAHILDVNVGIPDIDQIKAMEVVLSALLGACDLPLSIDTTNAGVLETALKMYPGRALINSISAEKRKDRFFELAKKYGAALILLPVDESGVPQKLEKRINIANKLIREAERRGFGREDMLIDVIALPIATNPEVTGHIMEMIRYFNKNGFLTTIGLSNLSYGLPEREWLNTIFLHFAIYNGLSSAILNPLSLVTRKSLLALAAICDMEHGVEKFINACKQGKKNATQCGMSIEQEIKAMVLSGDKENLISLLKKALNDYKPKEILTRMIIPALQEAGVRFEKGEFYLPEMIKSAETMREAFEFLKPELLKVGEKIESSGRIVMATVKGDIHDIGKNIVVLLLSNNGFEVYDLGKDVSKEEIVNKAREYKADIIGLSALMTTTAVEIKNVIELVRKELKTTKVMCGGAVVTDVMSKKFGADGYAKDAFHAIAVAKELIRK
ncbi:MAG: homocysteine S-methyltransferase family protein [Candidatus Hydrogenedentota bacterium]